LSNASKKHNSIITDILDYNLEENAGPTTLLEVMEELKNPSATCLVVEIIWHTVEQD